jgi:aryl-alcohol dehydrogenase-like predicted oxidoreductase
VPIPGTKRRTYLSENIAAAAVTLTQAELDQIAKALPLGIAAGYRYPDMSSLNR